MAKELQETIDFAVRLARDAGEITLKYFRRSFKAERKLDGSFVTAADRESERFIRAQIEEKFPRDAILGEEEKARSGDSGRQWIIDPIDGTYSFVHGVPLYGVMIGLEVDGDVILGVVNLPAIAELVSAARGLGCFWNGEPAHVSQTQRVEDALLLSTDFRICEQYGLGDAADRLRMRASSERTWGDCYGHVLIATGRADIMLDPIMNVWDCAALLPILEEAGGTFTDWRGDRTIRGGNAISTNGLLFDEVMGAVRGDN